MAANVGAAVAGARAGDDPLPETRVARKDAWPRDLWLDALWETGGLRPAEWSVAYCYSQYAGKKDHAWVMWDELMSRTGIKSRDTVWRATRRLVDLGWLKQVEPARHHRSPVYQLTVPIGRLLNVDDEVHVVKRPARGKTTRPSGAADSTKDSGEDSLSRGDEGSDFSDQGSDFSWVDHEKSDPIDPKEASDFDGSNSLHHAAGATPTETIAVADAKARRSLARAINCVTEDSGCDRETAVDFLRWLQQNRAPISDLEAYVAKLMWDGGIAPLLETYYAEQE